MRIVLVEPGKAARSAEIKEGLHSMQEIVDGPIQALYPWDDPVAVICNDEGKIDQLPLNRGLEDYDIITGTFFICGIQGENFSSLTDQYLEKYLQMFFCPEEFFDTPNGPICIRLNPMASPKKKEKKPPDYER